MINPLDLEASYQQYITDLKRFVPDGILEVNLALLQELDLLNSTEQVEDDLKHQFYVVETEEKLTLFNEKYVIWIVPHLIDLDPRTYTLIARNTNGKPNLEVAFSTQGIYNHSQLVLRVLEKFLDEIEENDSEVFNI